MLHYPCPLCLAPTRRRGSPLCPGCHRDLPWREDDSVLPTPLADRTLVPFYYRGPLCRLINDFKHRSRLPAGQVLGELLAEALEASYAGPEWPDLILPVPLHWRRHWWRGYNQTAELGKQLSRRLGIPCQQQLLQRVRATPRQQQLHRKQRLHNLQNAFVIHKPLPLRRVALLDDVITTGSTAHSLVQVLRAAGAHEVHLWAIAWTPVEKTGA